MEGGFDLPVTSSVSVAAWRPRRDGGFAGGALESSVELAGGSDRETGFLPRRVVFGSASLVSGDSAGVDSCLRTVSQRSDAINELTCLYNACLKLSLLYGFLGGSRRLYHS